MTEAECDLLKHCSRGHKFTMVCASITKWALRGEMPIECAWSFCSISRRWLTNF